MDQQNFKVIYTGKLKQGTDLNTAAAQLAVKFKQTPEKASQILKSNKEIILVKRAEHLKAYKFKSALEEIGLIVRLERASIATVKPKVKKPEKNEQSEVKEQKDNEQNKYSWTVDSIESKEEKPAKKESHINTTPIPKSPIPTIQQRSKPKEEKIEKPPLISDLFSSLKQVGGWIAGGLAFLFIAVKKFGLFKVFKLGGLVTAAAFAGYSPDEMCMGNGRCEDAVDDQIDICWDMNNLDDYDWDNMSAETYMTLKPKLEKDFIGCFIYEDTNEKVFLSPLDIRIDLMDNCDIVGKKGCIETVEPQIKSCFQDNNIGNYVSAETFDFYMAVEDNQKAFQKYYACFLDDKGEKMFKPILDNWSYYYLEEGY